MSNRYAKQRILSVSPAVIRETSTYRLPSST